MDVFAWLSADGSRYLAISELTLIFFAALVIAGACSTRVAMFLAGRRGSIVFLGLAFLTLFASRWPTLFAGMYVLDEDESAHIAIAMTSLHHPIAWHDFDNLTSGPFNTYVLMLPALVGLHLSFLTTAILTLAMEYTAIAAMYGTLSLVFDSNVARAGIVPPIVFWSVTVRDEFVHYSSEIFSIALCSVMVWLLALAWRRGFPSKIVATIGILGGIVPFAKLQSAPLAAAIVAATIALLAFASGVSPARRRQCAGALAGGVIAAPLLLLGSVWMSGSIGDFWTSYIRSSLAYVLFDAQPLSYLVGAPEMGPYVDWLAALTAAGIVVAIVRFRDISPATRAAFGIALLIFASATYCVFAPKRASEHYLLYEVIPVASTAAVALGISLAIAGRARVRGGLVAAFVVACLLVQGGVARAHNQWADSAYPSYIHAGDEDELVTDIKANLHPGDRMVMWGWRPQYYVYTSTLLGTRDAYSFDQYSTLFNPFQQYYRDRYIADITANRPEGFLDAGAESWDGGQDTKDAIESWPEVSAMLSRDYVLAARFKRYRLFVRKDLPHTEPAPSPTPSPLATSTPSPLATSTPSPAPSGSPSITPTPSQAPTSKP